MINTAIKFYDKSHSEGLPPLLWGRAIRYISSVKSDEDAATIPKPVFRLEINIVMQHFAPNQTLISI
ncbi:hypothetical protein SAMN06298216_2259 [Spirosomataceae bacterium TFI 002]|nr:hypothetical protein SAMN06298216_2259 [Spirosomataceae bacterium TFI 002]